MDEHTGSLEGMNDDRTAKKDRVRREETQTKTAKKMKS